jgi:Flp pilus assembly protein TadD
MEDPDAAVHYARAALDAQPHNRAFRNTLGYAYESKARRAEPLERDGLLRQATKIFEDGIKADRADPFCYLGLHQVMRQRERNEARPEARMKLRLDMLSMLEEAYDATGESHMIAGPLANMKEILGEPKEAIVFLKSEVARHPQDSRLRDLLVRMLTSTGENDDALSVASEGTKHNPAAWRLQRHIARLQRQMGGAPEAVAGHYEAAFRHNKSDPALIAEYGAFLFINGRYSDAERIFNQGRQLPGPERKRVNEYWEDRPGRSRVFSGEIHSITAAVGHVMAIPENFTAIFWRTHEAMASFRERERVTFTVGFSASGAVARTIRKA